MGFLTVMCDIALIFESFARDRRDLRKKKAYQSINKKYYKFANDFTV